MAPWGLRGARFRRAIRLAVIALTAFCWTEPTYSQERSREERLERELESLRARLKRVEEELERDREEEGRRKEGGEAESTDGPRDDPRAQVADAEPPAVEFTPFWTREALDRPGALRGVYEKPFLASVWRRAYIGGYTEFEYHSFEDRVLEIPEGFRMHRTNLFLFTEITERVHFGSEIEFETEFEGGDTSDDIEVAVEMAFVDWTLFEELKIRGGALLVPLGRVNVNHDGPIRELTERPLVSTYVIPSTLTEAGIGPHGSIGVLDDLSLTYEVYAVNGFSILDSDGTLAADVTEVEKVLREGRTSIGGDNNSGVAATGRVGVEVLNALEAGFSWHVGTYDEDGDNLLRIFAGDVAYVLQPAESWVELGLEGEIAVSDFERNTFARTSGVPDEFWGYYVQGSVGGMPPVLRELVPHVFDDDGSQFTLVLRYDWADLDGDTGEFLEPGINFRPTYDTVFKFSYKISQKSIGLRNLPGERGFDDEGFVFSIASYF